MSQINKISIKQKLINLSPIRFKNIINDTDIIELFFNEKNTLFLQTLYDSKIISTKILDKSSSNNLKRRLSEIDLNEKFVFKIKIYDASCFFSKYSVYFGEITLNQDKNGYFLLKIYRKYKYSTYVKEYIPVDSYISLM
jgi:hypothetical protein